MGSKWRFTVFAGLAAMIASMTAQKVMTDKVFWKLVRREIEEEEEIVHQLSQQHVKQTLERKETT